VLEACVPLERFRPLKSTSTLRPDPEGGSSPEPSLGLKLFIEAQASINAPSTEKCSLDISFVTRGCARTVARNLAAIAPSSRRSRFFENTVASHTGSSIARPTNQRNNRSVSSAPSPAAPSALNKRLAAAWRVTAVPARSTDGRSSNRGRQNLAPNLSAPR
jgi:hypothetical protein